jgi:hypothetical protein
MGELLTYFCHCGRIARYAKEPCENNLPIYAPSLPSKLAEVIFAQSLNSLCKFTVREEKCLLLTCSINCVVIGLPGHSYV